MPPTKLRKYATYLENPLSPDLLQEIKTEVFQCINRVQFTCLSKCIKSYVQCIKWYSKFHTDIVQTDNNSWKQRPWFVSIKPSWRIWQKKSQGSPTWQHTVLANHVQTHAQGEYLVANNMLNLPVNLQVLRQKSKCMMPWRLSRTVKSYFPSDEVDYLLCI